MTATRATGVSAVTDRVPVRAAWTGDELVIWGGLHDPSSPFGPTCDLRRRFTYPCDPETPTKRAYENAGGTIVPAWP